MTNVRISSQEFLQVEVIVLPVTTELQVTCMSGTSSEVHVLWGRYLDTFTSNVETGCHTTFDGRPGNNSHDIHNLVGGWSDRNTATSGLSYPFATNPKMW